MELTQSLGDREILQFVKAWQNQKSEHGRVFAFTYQEAKIKFRNPPLLIAEELSYAEASRIETELGGLGIEIKFGAEAPVTSGGEVTSSATRILSIFYGAVTVLLLTLAGVILFRSEEKSPLITHSVPPDLRAINPPSSEAELSHSDPIDARTPPIPGPSGEMSREAVTKLLNASVFIRGSASLGSGFFITDSGHVITNHHVVAQMTEPVVVLRDGRQFRAQKLQLDEKLDLALLKIPHSDHEFLRLGNANDLYPGESIITIGNPGGLSFTVTRGIVSYVGRMINGVPFIQTDAAINRGNSGGPMINQRGEVVAVNTLTSMREQGISFSVPINFICSNGGMASHLRTVPRACPPFDQSTQPPGIEQAIASEPSERGGHGLPLEHYQKEANGYKSEADREMAKLRDQETEVNERIERYRQRLTSTTNMDEIFKLEAEIKKLQVSLDDIYQDSLRVQVRYLDQVIGLIERQRGDPSFQAHSGQLTDEIQRLNAQKRSIQSKLR